MDPVLFAFYAFAAIAVIAAGGVISVRNPVHAVLCLILTFFSVACVWLLLSVCVASCAITLPVPASARVPAASENAIASRSLFRFSLMSLSKWVYL